MANSALQGNIYNIDQEFRQFLGNHMTYEALKMRESRLSKAKEEDNMNEYNRLGGEATHDYIKKELKTERDSIYNPKKIGMDTGKKNQFLSTHTKDKRNTNPTSISTGPQMNKGSINRKIMDNKEVYNEGYSNLTIDKGITRITCIDDMMDLINTSLSEDCYFKKYNREFQRFEISKLGGNNRVIIDNKDGKIRVFYVNRTFGDEEKLKAFDLDRIEEMESYIRLLTIRMLGKCYDKNTLTEEIHSIRYLIRQIN